MENKQNLTQAQLAEIEALTSEQLKTVRLNIQGREYNDEQTREAVAEYVADGGNVADLLAAPKRKRNRTRANKKYPVLDELVGYYGGQQLDYVSDCWGNDPSLMTPEEVLQMHKQLNWNDDGYRVVSADEPGDAVLLDADGVAILRIPEEA